MYQGATVASVVDAIVFRVRGVSILARAMRNRSHFSPEERLDAIDAELIDAAKRSIDFASYSLMLPLSSTP
jgi:hypothetical protein